ncbi:MAG TPA: divalent-cation tolerance protein CutA [Saprospiraceae bacterium]|nr:divalent-cation tolerance protein CutA [Saprospiraceae bacterium]
MEITLFYITTGDQAAASKLGHLAVDKKLAACANYYPMQSIFPWDNEMKSEAEFVLILKTIPLLKNELAEFIITHHVYEVPCVMNWNVEVNDKYGDWVKKNVMSARK